MKSNNYNDDDFWADSTISSPNNTSISSASKSPCPQCVMFRKRLKSQVNQSLHRHTPRKTTPTKTSTGDGGDIGSTSKLNKSVMNHNKSSIRKKLNFTCQPVHNPVSQPMNTSTSVSDQLNQINCRFHPKQTISKSIGFWSLFNTTKMLKTLSSNSVIYLLYLLISLVIFCWINSVQTIPFIDEIFHIPQAQTYCVGKFFDWNDKITTPPGLYLVSYVLLKPIGYIFQAFQWNFCSLFALRFTNVLFSVGNFMLINKILQLKKTETKQSTASSFAISTLPPLYFFTFLYYTDSGSLFFILLSYHKFLLQQHPAAAFSGFISLWFRQTNIVWIFFLASQLVLNIMFELSHQIHLYRKKRFSFLFYAVNFKEEECNFYNLRYVLSVAIEFISTIILQCWPYIIDGVCFMLFLVINNGIVLGDRSSHQASLHLAQIPYFLTFVTIFSSPWLFSYDCGKYFVSKLKTNPLLIMISGVFLFLCLTPKFTYVHPYLLADSRHYTFYLWKRVWSSSVLRYALVPLYLYTLVSMWNLCQFYSFQKNIPKYRSQYKLDQWVKMCFILCTLITIVPQQLIEFRYFLTPYLLWRLNLKPQTVSGWKFLFPLYAESILSILINIFTIVIFSTKTFQFPGSTQLERIIW